MSEGLDNHPTDNFLLTRDRRFLERKISEDIWSQLSDVKLKTPGEGRGGGGVCNFASSKKKESKWGEEKEGEPKRPKFFNVNRGLALVTFTFEKSLEKNSSKKKTEKAVRKKTINQVF